MTPLSVCSARSLTFLGGLQHLARSWQQELSGVSCGGRQRLPAVRVAAAIVQSSPENPIGTLERFAERRITTVNENSRKLWLCEPRHAGAGKRCFRADCVGGPIL
jgi:hypothetical protein